MEKVVFKFTGKKRKRWTRDVIDRQTLEVLYLEKCLHVQHIADLYGKTRQRIWQLLKKYGIHNNSRVIRTCLFCGKSFPVVRSRVRDGLAKYCNENCLTEHKRSLGYEPSKQGQRIGRKVIEDWLGFKLPVGFIVHHEDGNQGHNGPENLFVFPCGAEHTKYHHAKRNGNGVLPYQEMNELPGKIDEWLSQGYGVANSS